MWNWRKIITIKMYTESFSIVHYHPNGAFKNHAPPSLASDHRVISLTQFSLLSVWETRVVFVVEFHFISLPPRDVIFGMKYFPSKVSAREPSVLPLRSPLGTIWTLSRWRCSHLCHERDFYPLARMSSPQLYREQTRIEIISRLKNVENQFRIPESAW